MDTHAAFELLREADASGTRIDTLPEHLRPADRDEAYAVQAHWAEQDGGVVGWKIAATSQAGQRHLNIDGPIAGRVLAARVFPPGPVPLDGTSMRLAELEFAFVLGRDLPPRDQPYSETEVADAVAGLRLSFELPGERFTDVTRVGAEQLIADLACGHRLVLGPAADADWRGVDLAGVEVAVRSSSGAVHTGTGAAVLGGPLPALTWLVNELSGQGVGLRAGEFVTTGVCTEPLPVAPGETITGDWGPFGTMQVSFT